MHQAIQIEIREAFDRLIGTLASLSQDQLNQVPFPGSWTAAQVGDHLLKSYGIISLLDGNTGPVYRPVDQKAVAIKTVFLDFGIQMESPDFILPSEGWINKETLIRELEQKAQIILESPKSRDLSRCCLDFELPGSGLLTGWEWIHFITYHTQRHLHQLEKIMLNINVKSERI